MLKDTLFRVRRADGLQTLQRRGEHGARELTTHRMTLPAGGSGKFVSADEETVVVLIDGRGQFEAGDHSWSVQRGNVFSDRPTALLLPPAVKLTVSAESPLEAVLISTPAPAGGEPVLCSPNDVAVVERGTDLYQREVRNLFTTDPHARRLMVGETVNAKGHWSSYPPHKHDGKDSEPRLEEMYYYPCEPAGRVRPPHLLHCIGRSGDPSGPRWGRGAHSVRLSLGERAAALRPVLPVGDRWRRAEAGGVRGPGPSLGARHPVKGCPTARIYAAPLGPLRVGVMKRTAIALLSALIVFAALTSRAAAPISVMILDGESGGTYHDWQRVTPVLKKMLDETGLFATTVVTTPPAAGDFSSFMPDFAKYQVVV